MGKERTRGLGIKATHKVFFATKTTFVMAYPSEETIYRLPSHAIICSHGSHHYLSIGDAYGAQISTMGLCTCKAYNGGRALEFPRYNGRGTEEFDRIIKRWREWVLVQKGYDHERKVDRIISRVRDMYVRGILTRWKPQFTFVNEPLCESKGCPEGRETWSPDCECSQCHFDYE